MPTWLHVSCLAHIRHGISRVRDYWCYLTKVVGRLHSGKMPGWSFAGLSLGIDGR